jgi:hypothetical protein
MERHGPAWSLCVLALSAVSISVSAAPVPKTVSFAGVASAGGVNGTQWRSEVILSNLGGTAATTLLEIVPRDGSATAASLSLTMAPGETRHLPDVYVALKAPSGAGTLRVTGNVYSWVRTFNQSANGTFGLAVPPVQDVGAFRAGSAVYFPVDSPSDPAKEFRSNVLLLNLGAATANFTISAGSALRTQDVPAGTQIQISGIGGWLGLPAGPSVLSITADGSWFGYVTTIDPATGDPTPVLGLRGDARASTSFSGVASAGGVNGTQWRSEARLFNPRPFAQSVELELVPRGESDVSAATTIRLEPSATRVLPDVYSAFGVASGAGTLRVRGDVLAWVRTFNQGAGATFGTDVPGATPELAIGAGAVAAFPVSATADVTRGFRSNLLLTNVESRSVTLTVTSGSASSTITISPGAFVQQNDVGAWLGLSAGTKTVQVSGDGRWTGLVTTIDPTFGDPTGVQGLLTTSNPMPTERGEAIGVAAAGTFGPAGGSLSLPDSSVTVTVPAGALASPTTLTLQPSTNLAWGGAGNAVVLGPAGVSFAKPVTLSFRVPAEASDGIDLAGLGVAVQDGDGYWNWVSDASRDEARKTVTIAVTRLGTNAVGANPAVRALFGESDDTAAALVRGVMLLPSQAKVQKGKTQALVVTFCYPDGALAPLSPTRSYRGFACTSDFPSPVWTDRWSVNDVLGGDSTHGSVRQVDRYNAVFTAPGKRPSSPVVGATAQVYADRLTLRLHSSLEIVDTSNLKGSLSIQMLKAADTLAATVDMADATLEWATGNPAGWNTYRLTGTWELKTPTLTLRDGTICKAQGSLRRPITPTGLGFFHVFAGTPPLFRGSVLDVGFTFACVDPLGSEYTNHGGIWWGTYTSADCSSASLLKGVPISDPKAPKGSFTIDCFEGSVVSTGTWDFREE